jgi:FtsZ-binding cell division protein ZapB
MNKNLTILLIIALLIIVVLFVVYVAIPFLKKKNVDISKQLNTALDLVDKAGAALNVANEVIPTNPVLGTLNIIEKWAKIAVGNAQQLYHAGDIEKGDRAAAAENVVLTVLGELSIPVDDNKKTLIDASIKEAVNALGHAPVDIKILQDQNSQLIQNNAVLKNTNTTLQQQNTQLNSTNVQLQTTIANIQSSVSIAMQ